MVSCESEMRGAAAVIDPREEPRLCGAERLWAGACLEEIVVSWCEKLTHFHPFSSQHTPIL